MSATLSSELNESVGIEELIDSEDSKEKKGFFFINENQQTKGIRRLLFVAVDP